ncbi:MAG: ZIP family metal transporter [Bacilli bacterium]|nr:ZIP family metal transporter [Bacilli bacterium]
MKYFINLNAVEQTLIATFFTWGVTSLGAASVFLFKKLNYKILNLLLGFAGGVMIAASFWSLLMPAIDLTISMNQISWLIPSIGFLCGGFFVICSDILLDKVLSKHTISQNTKRSALLVGAITIHNIPEGMAVGVAFGSAALGLYGATTISACLLALGIGLQNFPEGAGVALPLRREGYSQRKSFLYGQASGMVEPIFGVLGAILVCFVRSILPFLLSFSAGCMICVVGRELLPEASKEHKNFSSLGLILGFIIMMILDVSLG